MTVSWYSKGRGIASAFAHTSLIEEAVSSDASATVQSIALGGALAGAYGYYKYKEGAFDDGWNTRVASEIMGAAALPAVQKYMSKKVSEVYAKGFASNYAHPGLVGNIKGLKYKTPLPTDTRAHFLDFHNFTKGLDDNPQTRAYLDAGRDYLSSIKNRSKNDFYDLAGQRYNK